MIELESFIYYYYYYYLHMAMTHVLLCAVNLTIH